MNRKIFFMIIFTLFLSLTGCSKNYTTYVYTNIDLQCIMNPNITLYGEKNGELKINSKDNTWEYKLNRKILGEGTIEIKKENTTNETSDIYILKDSNNLNLKSFIKEDDYLFDLDSELITLPNYTYNEHSKNLTTQEINDFTFKKTTTTNLIPETGTFKRQLLYNNPNLIIYKAVIQNFYKNGTYEQKFENFENLVVRGKYKRINKYEIDITLNDTNKSSGLYSGIGIFQGRPFSVYLKSKSNFINMYFF